MNASSPLDLALFKRQLAPLRAVWDKRAKRIDALSLRERVILFLCIAAVLAAVFDTLVLAPLNARAQARSAAASTQAAELKLLREQFVISSQGNGSAAASALQRLAAAEQERDRLEADIRSHQSTAAALIGAGEGGLPALLQRLLAQQPGLTLLRLNLLDATNTRPDEPQLPGMRWQGVELQIEGSYAEQKAYLQNLERQLPGLQWGELRLRSQGQGLPARLQAQVFVLRMTP